MALRIGTADIAVLFDRATTARQHVLARDPTLVRALIDQVRIEDGTIEISCPAQAIAEVLEVEIGDDAPTIMTLNHPVRLTRSGRMLRLVQHNGTAATAATSTSLIGLLVKARRWWAELRRGEVDITTLATVQGVQPAYVTRVLRLAFVSPAVVEAVLAGRQSDAATVNELTLGGGIDPDWTRQKQRLVAAAG